MNDLSALTPPLIMAVIVVAAIVVFLRHEMSRGRSGQRKSEQAEPAQGNEEEGAGPERGPQAGSQAGPQAAADQAQGAPAESDTGASSSRTGER